MGKKGEKRKRKLNHKAKPGNPKFNKTRSKHIGGKIRKESKEETKINSKGSSEIVDHKNKPRCCYFRLVVYSALPGNTEQSAPLRSATFIVPFQFAGIN